MVRFQRFEEHPKGLSPIGSPKKLCVASVAMTTYALINATQLILAKN